MRWGRGREQRRAQNVLERGVQLAELRVEGDLRWVGLREVVQEEEERARERAAWNRAWAGRGLGRWGRR